MQLHTFQYDLEKGWSVENFPDIDSENTLVIVFADPKFINKDEPLQQLRTFYSQAKIIGCSTAGEILGSMIYDNILSIAVVKFEKTKIQLEQESLADMNDSYSSAINLAKKFKPEGLVGIFVLSDGLNVNGSELVRGFNEATDNKITITGGLAGDGENFKSTWIISNGKIASNNIVAVGFYGANFFMGHASRGGWDIFGPERMVTRSKANVLYELDGKPALKLYKEYLGERASELPASGLLYPLSIRKDKSDTKQLVRTILAIDEKAQSLTFAGDVPQGHLAQLMRANFDRLINSASEAGDVAINLMQEHGKQYNSNILSIAISCVGRRLLLGERTEEETESLISVMPKNTQQIGFYSYGEISPYGIGSCDLHNQTMTVTIFYEE